MSSKSNALTAIVDQLNSALILNPVENFPELLVNDKVSCLEGLYITDKDRTEQEKLEAKILFGGRDKLIDLVLDTYAIWNEALRSDCITFRVFSGLHAHMSIFQSIAELGDEVLLLPEQAGGHYATPDILQRLGLRVSYLPVDSANHVMDISQAMEMAAQSKARFLFVDRSEGLNYEDFSSLCDVFKGYKIFDASQYLSNILFGDFRNPFDMGFDMVVSTTHKNFPGPQHAFICARDRNDGAWTLLSAFLRATISNIHAANIIKTRCILCHPLLPDYSHEMLNNAAELERSLLQTSCPGLVVSNVDIPRTHHLWIALGSGDAAMQAFRDLETAGILVNYRKLPYSIGYGLRLGTAAATLQGMDAGDTPVLANAIAAAVRGEPIDVGDVRQTIVDMKEKNKYAH